MSIHRIDAAEAKHRDALLGIALRMVTGFRSLRHGDYDDDDDNDDDEAAYGNDVIFSSSF